MGDLAGQVIMITGASGNLGRAIVAKYRADGAKLVLVDRRMEALRAAFPDLIADPTQALARLADLTDPTSVEAVVTAAMTEYGRIDVLINTVGGYRAGSPLHETPLSTLKFMLDLNAATVFIVSQAVIPHMLRQGSGKIVNIAARPGLTGKANAAAYSAAKAAVMRLTESMAAELKSDGINVNCLIPGTLDTPQNRQASPDADYANWVSLDSIAGVIYFLTSTAARDIHGAAIPVYGYS